MTLQRQHVTIVIGARVGQPPIYPQVGQGLLGGTIEQVHTGDSISQHKLLDELRQIFSVKFDRGELSPGMLQRVLWESNWWRAILPFVQRAADLLHLASASGIAAGGLAAQRCAEIEAALSAMTQERIPATPIGDALLRGEPIPSERSLSTITCDLSSADDRKLALTEILRTSLRADGIRPLCEADPQALAQHREAAPERGVHGIDFHAPSIEPLKISDAEADALNAKQWNAMVDYLDTRLPPGWGDGGGFLVDKAIEALNALGLAQHSAKGLTFATPEQLADALHEVHSYEDLSPELIAERMFLNAHGAVTHSMAFPGADFSGPVFDFTRDQPAPVDTLDVQDCADAIAGLADDQRALVTRIESQRRGLMALAAYIGETCTGRVLSAMERDA